MKKHFIVLCLLAATVAGCAPTVNTHGNIILPSRLAEIKINQTTQDEVVQLLGTPSTKSNFDANIWYYISSVTKTTALHPNKLVNRKVVAITFHPSGTVAGLQQLNQDHGKNIQPDEASTHTQGQSMGIVEQMMGNVGIGAP